jgi:uncharacterized protein (TIGR02268 family)
MLRVDAPQIEHQVEIYRRPRSAESYRQEVEELKLGMARLRQEVAKQRASPGPSGHEDSLVATIVGLTDIQQASLTYEREETSAPVSVIKVEGLRLTKHWVALRLSLSLGRQGESWDAAGASLQNAQGRVVKMLRPWQGVPSASTKLRTIVIVSEDEASLPSGRYTLKMWDEGGGQTVTLEGLKLP